MTLDDPRIARILADYPQYRFDKLISEPPGPGLTQFCRFCGGSNRNNPLVLVRIVERENPMRWNNPKMCQDPVSCDAREEVLRFRKAVADDQ